MPTIIHTASTLNEPIDLPLTLVLDILNKGDFVEEYGLVAWGSNHTFVVSLNQESVECVAIYKPKRGERPLWDFPMGSLCKREYAAYLISERLGWQIVPPTVLRSGPHGLGSLQIYIHHDPDVHYFALEERHIPQIQRIALFDAITNNADRKGGHCLLDQDDKIWGIDHGLTFNIDYKLRTVIWDFAGQLIPDALLADLEHLQACLQTDDETLALFKAQLSVPEVEAFTHRLDKLIQSRTFPLPGRGPNRPWPAI